MANHMASIKTPCYTKLAKSVELLDCSSSEWATVTIEKGELIKVVMFDCVNNIYNCRSLRDTGPIFCATEDQLDIEMARPSMAELLKEVR